MLKRLILAGALACSCAGAAVATPIPAASTALIREALVVQAKVGRRHTPAGHVRRPYVIVLAMGALVGLIATTVMADWNSWVSHGVGCGSLKPRCLSGRIVTASVPAARLVTSASRRCFVRR